jgi:hypothetical protein
LIHEPAGRGRERAIELQQRPLAVVLEWRPSRGGQHRVSEVERRKFRQAQSGALEAPERLPAEPPHRGAVDLLVVERKPRAAERLDVAPDRARVDLALRGERADRNPHLRRVDCAQDLPLPDDFRIARHEGVLPFWLQVNQQS